MFNLWGFTGARFGEGFFDCKMPGIHLFYLLITKIVGKSVPRVRFMSTVVVSIPGIILYYMTGSFWIGLAFITMINSGWLLSFHGNVGQIPAGLMAISMVSHDPWLSIPLWLGSLFVESKAIVLMIPLFLFNGWYLQLGIAFGIAGLVAILIRLLYPKVWGYLWEANIVIAGRLRQYRINCIKNECVYGDNYMCSGLGHILPWVLIGVANKPDIAYWIPIAMYMALIFFGIAVRPNHFIVLIPWVILAGIPWQIVLALCAADVLSALGYWKHIWIRFYPAIHNMNYEGREIGLYLKDKPGTLWVNSMNTGIYVYAQKKPYNGFCEQVEMNDTVHERRKAWVEKWKENPPDWVVKGVGSGYKFEPRAGYKLVAKDDYGNKIYQKE